jgi:hypothetical protein
MHTIWKPPLIILAVINASVFWANAADYQTSPSITTLARESDQPLTAAQLQPLVKQLWQDPEAAGNAVEVFQEIGAKGVAAIAAIVPGLIDLETPKAWTFGGAGPHGLFHKGALHAIGPASVPALCQILRDEDAEQDLRQKICDVLSKIVPRQADRQLYKEALLALRDRDDGMSSYAIPGLAKGLGYRDLALAIPQMSEEAIRQSKSYSGLDLALWAIRPIIDQAIADGVPLASWWTPELRTRLLANLGGVAAKRGSPSHEIIELFVLAGDDSIAPRLLNYLRSAPAGGLAPASAWALGELDKTAYLSDVLDLLTRISKDDLFQAQYRPIAAAAKLGGKEAAPVLKTLLKSDIAAAAHAAVSLSQIEDNGAVAPIKARFESELRGGWELSRFLTAMINLGEDQATEQAIQALFTHERWEMNEPEYVAAVVLNLENGDLRHRGTRQLAESLLDESNQVGPRVLQEIRDAFAKKFELVIEGDLSAQEFR